MQFPYSDNAIQFATVYWVMFNCGCMKYINLRMKIYINLEERWCLPLIPKTRLKMHSSTFWNMLEMPTMSPNILLGKGERFTVSCGTTT